VIQVKKIEGEIVRLQAELEDYRVLSAMDDSSLVILLNSLVREELKNGFSVDKNDWGRKMRVQNVLSSRLR
jgi:hypothetical protein